MSPHSNPGVLPSGQGTDTPSVPLLPSLPKQNPRSLSQTSSEGALDGLSHNELLTFGWVVPMERDSSSPKAQISQEGADGREQPCKSSEGKRNGEKNGYPSVLTVITSACRLPCLL